VRRSLSRIVLFGCALFVAWLWCPRAFAQASPLLVELESTLGQVPGQVCVITRLIVDTDLPISVADISAADPSKAAITPGVWRFDPKDDLSDEWLLPPGWKTERPTPDHATTNEALLNLARQRKRALPGLPSAKPTCPEDAEEPLTPRDCAPEIELVTSGKAAASYITCSSKPAGVANDRVAVLWVDFHDYKVDPNKKKPLTAVHLDGTTVTLDLKQQLKGAVSVRVVGGHYVESSAESNVGSVLRLRLVPRCVRRTLELPDGLKLEGATLALHYSQSRRAAARPKGGGAGKFECTKLSRSPVELDVPVDVSSSRLSIEAGPPAGPVTLRADWHTPEPPQPIELRYTRVAFSWRRHCHYPVEATEFGAVEKLAGDARVKRMREICPTAALPEARVNCEAKDIVWAEAQQSAACVYTCGQLGGPSKHAPFTLPTRVRFSTDQQRGSDSAFTWEDLLLTHNGAMLTSFIDPDRMILRVMFRRRTRGKHGEVARDRFAAADVHRVHLQLPSGRSVAVAVPEGEFGEQKELAPGLTCNQRLTTQYISKRHSFKPEVVVADSGSVYLPEPTPLAEWIRMGVLAGGGMIGGGATEDGPQGSVEVVPQGELGGWAELRPRGSHWSFEGRLSALLTLQSTFSVNANDLSSAASRAQDEDEATSELYQWWILEAALRWQFATNAYGSFGLGFAFGGGVEDGSSRIVGDPQLFRPAVQLTLGLTDLLGLEGELYGRGLLGTEFMAYETDFRGAPRRDELSGFLVMVGARARFGRWID